MTTTLANMPSTPTDVAVKFLDQSKVELQQMIPLNDGRRAQYVYNDGNLQDRTLISVQTQWDQKLLRFRSSIQLTTDEVVTDEDDVETGREPVQVTITWVHSGYAKDVPALMSMIGTAFSLCFNGVTSKVPNTGTLQAISRGLLHDLFG